MTGFVGPQDFDLLWWCGAIVGVVAAAAAINKAARSIARGFKSGISAAVDLSDTAHLVRYHLGPNSSEPPLHKRVTDNQAMAKQRHEENIARFAAIEAAQTTAAVVAEATEARRAHEGDKP